jgi:PAS domain S-box-containing protein
MLAAIAVASFLILAFSESLAVRNIQDRVETQDIARRVHHARRLFARLAENKANLISEFSFWDDTWDVVNHPTTAASREHIRENFLEWLPQRYGDGLIEIWNKRGEPVWSWSDTIAVGVEQEIDRPALFRQLEAERLSAGYVRGSKGLLLLASALVLHESDQALQGPSNGFIIAAEPIDSARIAEIEDELQVKLEILPLSASWPADSVGIETRGDSIQTVFVLAGYNRKPVALVALRSSRSLMQQLALSSSILLLATMLVGILVLAILWRAGNRLVVRPLSEIGGALESMQQKGRLSRIETRPPTHEWSLFVTAFNSTIDALKSSERRYQVLFDHAADAQFLLDAKTQTILEANPAAEVLAGRDRREMIGRPLSTVVRLEPSPSRDGTSRVKRHDGSLLTVSVVTAELEIGGAPRQLASLRDLTKNEALAAQLRQAQKMEAIGSLAGGIAHDFNNLLGAVLLASSTLKEDAAGNPEFQASIDTIEQASRRGAELTRRLLSFARREQNSTSSVALNEVVQNVVQLCERTFDRAIRIEVALTDPVPAVAGDAGQLEQVLLNLCINSRDAMPSGGTLRITTASREVTDQETAYLRDVEAGSYVTISVADTGSGLTVEAEQHLFEPFFTTKGQGKGTGLGLAMVYGLVRAHGGGIQAHNRPGEGVEFEIYLPVALARTEASIPARASRPADGTERVLMVDDELALRKSVSRALSRLGYAVDVAENGVQGVQMVQQAPEAYDLVILDLMMPEMGGAQAFQLIRRIRPDMKVLLCSGYSADGERNELLREGAAGFLQKPFDTNELAALVRDTLDRVSSA